MARGAPTGAAGPPSAALAAASPIGEGSTGLVAASSSTTPSLLRLGAGGARSGGANVAALAGSAGRAAVPPSLLPAEGLRARSRSRSLSL